MPEKKTAPRSGGTSPLVLKQKDLRANTAKLFEQLDKDQVARQRFIADPTGHVSEQVARRPLPAQAYSNANRILFAMLANDGFRQWIDDYQGSRDGKKVSQEQFSRDFADAVVKFGDSDLLKALFKNASDGFGLPGFSDVAQQLLVGPDRTAVTAPATPSTSDASLRSTSNFPTNTQGLRLGDATLVDPALMRAVVGQLVAHAKELKAAGTLGRMDVEIR